MADSLISPLVPLSHSVVFSFHLCTIPIGWSSSFLRGSGMWAVTLSSSGILDLLSALQVLSRSPSPCSPCSAPLCCVLLSASMATRHSLRFVSWCWVVLSPSPWLRVLGQRVKGGPLVTGGFLVGVRASHFLRRPQSRYLPHLVARFPQKRHLPPAAWRAYGWLPGPHPQMGRRLDFQTFTCKLLSLPHILPSAARSAPCPHSLAVRSPADTLQPPPASYPPAAAGPPTDLGEFVCEEHGDCPAKKVVSQHLPPQPGWPAGGGERWCFLQSAGQVPLPWPVFPVPLSLWVYDFKDL